MTRIFAASIPKSGTHVLQRTFEHMNFTTHAIRKGMGPVSGWLTDEVLTLFGAEPFYLFGHWRADERTVAAVLNAGLAPIVLIRDPRDICLSMADFLAAGRPERLIRRAPALRQMPLRDLIAGTITGFNLPGYKGHPICKHCEGWMEWESHGATLLRFEDFERAVRTQAPIDAIARVGVDPAAFLEALTKVFRGPAQAKQNKGRTVRWATEFDLDLMRLWNEEAHGLASRFGYGEAV